jgi:hypothetical protein
VEGRPNIRYAPDTMVIFGRPKGDRGSYRQWEEDNVPPTVVFEVLSPGNAHKAMVVKKDFYEKYGVEEYYIYDPDIRHLSVYLRSGQVLESQPKTKQFISPRLGIRFDLGGAEMEVYYPDGRRFLSFEEVTDALKQAKSEAEQAKIQVDQAKIQADQAQIRADQSQIQAEQAKIQAEQTKLQLDDANQLFLRLAELSRKARRQAASAQELEELDRLEQRASAGGS